jgi:membrane-anchored mycosin MYCP
VRLLALLALLLVAPVAGQATGQGVAIAVLDSGVDGAHPELDGRVQRSYAAPLLPGVPLDAGLVQPDSNGQGTGVASLAAGATLGVASQARILDFQVAPQRTGSAIDPAVEQAAIEAMDLLLQNPRQAPVVLLSFAANGVSGSGASTLAGQAERLAREGILVVVPASSQLSVLHASPSVLTVGAPDCPASSGHLTGENQPYKPDLVAPASGLLVAAPSTALNPAPTRTASGTAYAAAQVAGTAALMLEARPGLPVDALAALLRGSATDLGEPGADRCNGFGLLSPEAAVALARSWEDPLERFPTQPVPGPALPLLFAGLALLAVLRRRVD